MSVLEPALKEESIISIQFIALQAFNVLKEILLGYLFDSPLSQTTQMIFTLVPGLWNGNSFVKLKPSNGKNA